MCVRVHFCNIIRLTCPLGGFDTFCTPDELSEICASHNLTLFGYFCTVKLSVWCATVFLCEMQDSARGGLGGWGGSQHISFLLVSGYTMGTSHSLPSHHRSVIQPYFLSRSFNVALSNCSLMRVCVCVCRFSWISRSCEDVVGSFGGGGVLVFPWLCAVTLL